MSDETAFNQATAELGSVLRSIVPERISTFAKQPESPIERMFLIGLMSLSYTSPCYDFGDFFSRFVLRSDSPLPIVKVDLQAQIEGYRADFLLTVTFQGAVLGRVVVECDGHSFHERTKEQASRDRSRDRAMTLAGYKVMRFTGSEIYRDLMGCVSQAHEAAWQFYQGQPAA